MNLPERDFRRSLLQDANTLMFLRLIIGLVLASGLAYLVAALFVAGESLYRSAGALAVLASAGAAIVLYRQRRFDGAAQLLVWGIWLSMLLQIFLSNGLMSRSLMALPILIMLAGWLLPPRGAIVLCLASLLAGLVLAWGEQAGVLPLKTSPSPPHLVWLAYSIYIGLAAALAYVIFRGFRLRHEALHRLSEDLAAQVDMLTARETEQRLVMESVPVMLFHGDRDKRCLYANRNYADFYAANREKLTGHTVREILGAEAYDANGVEATLDRVLSGERFTYRAARPSRGGEEHMLDIAMIPEPDGHGGTRGFFVLLRDVTDEVRTEEARRRSEQMFASAFRSNPLAVAITQMEDGRYLDVNDAFVRLFGWSRQEAIGRTSLELGVWKAPETRIAWAAQMRQDGRVSNLEADVCTRNGETRRLLLSSEMIDMNGEPCALVMAADITERRRAEEEARGAMERFAKIFQASPMPISISRLQDGLCLDANNSFIEQFGWTKEDFIGRTSLEIGIWPDLPERSQWARQLLATGRVRNAETRLKSKDGVLHTVLISAERIRLGGEDCVIGMVHDITERLQAEADLRESERRLREAQVIGHYGSWEFDIAQDAFTAWSTEIDRIFEITADQGSLKYSDFIKALHRDDRSLFHRRFQEDTRAGRGGEYFYRLRLGGGRIKHLHVRCEIRSGADGKPAKVIGTSQDITEQVLAREEIQRLNAELERRVLERTAELQAANRELESFAYSISHDLRAPLRGIDGFSHLLAEEYAERLDETGRGYLDRVRRAAQRMGHLIDDILELSRVTRQEMRRVPVDLSQIAAELAEERSRSEPERHIETLIAPGCRAFGDPQLLRVLMQNLLENAWKYSGKADAPKVEFGCEPGGGQTVFYVRDNGVGFDMQYADRLFTPFQRLHKPEEFEGTGIGLATVARVVHRHGGQVSAESAPGQGATFRFSLDGSGRI